MEGWTEGSRQRKGGGKDGERRRERGEEGSENGRVAYLKDEMRSLEVLLALREKEGVAVVWSDVIIVGLEMLWPRSMIVWLVLMMVGIIMPRFKIPASVFIRNLELLQLLQPDILSLRNDNVKKFLFYFEYSFSSSLIYGLCAR
ncbi:hypothetical protein Tco_0968115 [Tanacetum coccineum]